MGLALSWVEVSCLVPRGWQELVGEVLGAACGSGVAFGPASLASAPLGDDDELVRAYYLAAEDGPERRAAIEDALQQLGRDTGAPELARLAPRFHALPAEDFARSWEKVWKPFRVGRLAVIRPSQSAPSGRRCSGDVVLRLEPGAVFGTGRHATTRLCLALLQEHAPRAKRVLDAGTGTGILAVAAALLGARHALGFDVDRHARAHFEDLAATNGVSRRCEFREGDFAVLGAADRGFDLVLANLTSDLVRDSARDLAARMRPGGSYVLSGCTAASGPEVLAALEAAGLTKSRVERRGRWLAFHGSRPS